MATAARRAAFRVLREVESGGSTLADRLAGPDLAGLDARDRALLHELVLGTLRHRGLVDHALAGRLDRPLGRLDPRLLTALRLGAYQVLRMRVPHRAAVSETVDLAREAAPRASGLANAVLRRLAREGPPALPDPVTDPLGWLTTAGSLPAWLAQRGLERLGPTTALARARSLLETPPLDFRFNPRIPDALERARSLGLEPQALSVPGAWRAAGEGRAVDLIADGVIYAQDQGSQLLATLAAAGTRVLDACAAPGGKSLLVADALGDTASVVAAELSSRRLRTLREIVRRWPAPNVHVVGADGRRPPFRASFDAVLLDAPCSGLGTLGRHPDVRWRARAEDLPRHAERQGALLSSLATLVRPGGRLVYGVCSAEPEETEEVVTAFRERHAEFVPAERPGWAAPFADGPYVRTAPERDGGDAFFGAVFTRREEPRSSGHGRLW